MFDVFVAELAAVFADRKADAVAARSIAGRIELGPQRLSGVSTLDADRHRGGG